MEMEMGRFLPNYEMPVYRIPFLLYETDCIRVKLHKRLLLCDLEQDSMSNIHERTEAGGSHAAGSWPQK